MAKRRRRPRQSKEEIGLALRRASLGKATGMVFEVIDCTYTVAAKGRREKVLVDGVSARLEPGQVLALLGPSGAGKTTLLSMLTLQRGIGRAHGKVLLNGQPFTPALYRQHAAFVAQHDQVWRARGGSASICPCSVSRSPLTLVRLFSRACCPLFLAAVALFDGARAHRVCSGALSAVYAPQRARLSGR